jgi:hypothetical protein
MGLGLGQVGLFAPFRSEFSAAGNTLKGRPLGVAAAIRSFFIIED